jgi:putative acetyltransferase
MAAQLRPFQSSDAEALSLICREAIAQIGPRAYSPKQIAAWLGRHPGAERYKQRAADGHMIFVAADEADAPLAYALLEIDEGAAGAPNRNSAPTDGHLDHLYCHPSATGAGLAEQLLTMAEDAALAHGLTRLYTEASELAVGAFERAGYVKTHRRDFAIEHKGEAVAIHNYAMEKRLT